MEIKRYKSLYRIGTGIKAYVNSFTLDRISYVFLDRNRENIVRKLDLTDGKRGGNKLEPTSKGHLNYAISFSI